jgi:hypothetical protein
MAYPFPELEAAQIEANRRALAAQAQQPLPQQPPPPPTIPATTNPALPPDLKAALDADIQKPAPSIWDSVRSLGSAIAGGVQDPSQWPEAVMQGLKGGASGATVGLSEFIPGMQVDPDSWAGSAGSLAGNIAGFMAGGAGLRAAGGAVKGLSALRNPVVAEMAAGGAQAGLESAIRPQARGQEAPEASDVAKHVMMGVALPPATRAVGKALGALGRKMGILPEKPPMPPGAAPDTNIPGADEVMGQGGILGVSGSKFTPEVEGQLRKFLSEPVDVNVASGAVHLPAAPRPLKARDLVVTADGRDGIVMQRASPDHWFVRVAGDDRVQTWPESQLQFQRPRWQTLADDIEPLGGRPQPQPEAQPVTTPDQPPMPPTGGTPPPTAGGGATVPPPDPNLGGAGLDQKVSFLELTRNGLRTALNKANLPLRVFQNDPAGRTIVQKMFDLVDQRGMIERNMATVFKKAITPLTEQEQEVLKIARLTHQNKGGIEEYLIQTTGPEAQRLITANRMINAETEAYRQRLVELGLLKPEQVIENYVPMMRYRAVRPGEIIVERMGSPVQVAEYYGGPPKVRAAMLKARTLDDIPQRMMDLPLHNILDMQVKAVARAIATEEQFIRGGLGEAGKVLRPDGTMATNWLAQTASKITDPELARRMDVLINDVLGTPRGALSGNVAMNEAMTFMKRLQFYHLIGMNPLTAAVNLTQQLIPFSLMSMSSYGKAIKMLIQNSPIEVEGAERAIPAREFAERFMGASGQYNQADKILLSSTAMGKVLNASEKMFRWSESANQRVAAIGGYLEGLARGMNQQEAMQFGRELNRYANQFGGFNTPEIFRTPGMSVIGQFKPFQIGYWGIMKDLVTNAGKGTLQIAEGNFQEGLRQVLPLVKYTTALGLLGGTSTLIGEAGVTDNNTLMGQLRRELPALMEPVVGEFAKHGLLGLFGVNLANQIGIGAVPFANTRANLQDVLWFLPGPSLTHVADVASAAYYLADRYGLNAQLSPNAATKAGINLNPQNFGGEISPDEVASMFTRGFPLAGPQLDRLRKWVKAAHHGGGEVEALNFLQAMGWETPSGIQLRGPTEQAPIDKALGLSQEVSNMRGLLMNPQKRQSEITQLQQEKELGHTYNMAMRTYDQMLAGGKHEEAEAYRRQIENQLGTPLMTTRRGYDAAVERRLYPADIRQQWGRPWPVEVLERLRYDD